MSKEIFVANNDFFRFKSEKALLKIKKDKQVNIQVKIHLKEVKDLENIKPIKNDIAK